VLVTLIGCESFESSDAAAFRHMRNMYLDWVDQSAAGRLVPLLVMQSNCREAHRDRGNYRNARKLAEDCDRTLATVEQQQAQLEKRGRE